jgi:hypothetical protein
MASKTSKVSVVDRGTAGGKSYYKTDITTLADGSVQRQTFRSDEKGNNSQLIQSVTVNSEGTVTKDELTSNATVNEQRDLKNPKSQLRQGIKRQVDSAAGELAENNIDGVTKTTLDKAALGSGNAALNEVQSLESLNTAPTSQPLVTRDIPASDNTRKSFGNHVYPLDLGKTKQDVIKFSMLEYVPQDFNQDNQFGFSNDARQGKRSPIGTVILPIPGGIQDNNSVSWAGQNMNALEAGLANVALNTIERGVEGAKASVTDITNALKANAGEGKTAVAQLFAGVASGTGTQLLTRTTGAVINPNLELLFSGPSLRTFSFSFKMNARESAESREIVKIIRFFKQGSAAQRSTSNLFLKSPHTFAVQYLHRGPEGDSNPFMGRIKECALQSVGVNYTPENNYATFQDGAMVSYQITLNFSELEPVFNDDYSQLDGDADTLIGF